MIGKCSSRLLIPEIHVMNFAGRTLGSELGLLDGVGPIFAGGGDAAYAVGHGDKDRPAAIVAHIKLDNALLVLAKTQADDCFIEFFRQLTDGDIVRHTGITPWLALRKLTAHRLLGSCRERQSEEGGCDDKGR